MFRRDSRVPPAKAWPTSLSVNVLTILLSLISFALCFASCIVRIFHTLFCNKLRDMTWTRCFLPPPTTPLYRDRISINTSGEAHCNKTQSLKEQNRSRVIVVGAGCAGLLAARDLAKKKNFDVVVIDAKEFFEFTPGILRAYVKPKKFDQISFLLKPVIEKMLGCKFVFGEVQRIDGVKNVAEVRLNERAAREATEGGESPALRTGTVEYRFDYCVIASGCCFNPLHRWGDSPWFPRVHSDISGVAGESRAPLRDERYLQQRKQRISEEHDKLRELNSGAGGTVLVVGAGFVGLEWVTELSHHFRNLKLTLVDARDCCLAPLPKIAQDYCEKHMEEGGISRFYGIKYEPESQHFWETIGLPEGSDATYICMGVKASNYFMPKETLSENGPGGGGWILINEKLQVVDRKNRLFGKGRVFAVGDCNFGCVGAPEDWKKGLGIPPIPKTSYPAEEQASHAVHAIQALDAFVQKQKIRSNRHSTEIDVVAASTDLIQSTWWPWGSGMLLTSLGPNDAVFVVGGGKPGKKGMVMLTGKLAALQKDVIEATKVDECKGGFLGRIIWHFVHHTPVHLWGDGAFWKMRRSAA